MAARWKHPNNLVVNVEKSDKTCQKLEGESNWLRFREEFKRVAWKRDPEAYAAIWPDDPMVTLLNERRQAIGEREVVADEVSAFFILGEYIDWSIWRLLNLNQEQINSAEVWQRVEQYFSRATAARLPELYRSFHQDEMKPGMTLQQFLGKKREVFMELQMAGDDEYSLSDKVFNLTILEQLPADFDSFKTVLRADPTLLENLSFDQLMERLIAEEKAIQQRKREERAAAMFAGRGRGDFGIRGRGTRGRGAGRGRFGAHYFPSMPALRDHDLQEGPGRGFSGLPTSLWDHSPNYVSRVNRGLARARGTYFNTLNRGGFGGRGGRGNSFSTTTRFSPSTGHSAKTCMVCDDVGHIAADCPFKAGAVQQRINAQQQQQQYPGDGAGPSNWREQSGNAMMAKNYNAAAARLRENGGDKKSFFLG